MSQLDLKLVDRATLELFGGSIGLLFEIDSSYPSHENFVELHSQFCFSPLF